MARFGGLLLAVALLAVPACSGGGSAPERPAAAPPVRAGEAVPVDSRALVSRRVVRRAVGQPVRIVGRELDPPTLPTQSCLWGVEFGVPLVELQVTPGPVARQVFDAAFGPAAGDDPREVPVGESAYAREGLTSRTLQVFGNGVVLSMEARDSPGSRLPRGALVDIANAVLRRLPRNPELVGSPLPRPCRGIDEDAVAAAMGADVRLRAGHADRGGSVAGDGAGDAVMCSWAGLPGHVVVTVRTNPVQITNFRANLSPRVYARVPGVPAEAWSQNNHAGDLLVFLDGALVEVTSLPGEGFSSPGVPTTPGEVRLARELVRALG
jgi:hypothetical protein